jgi:hypothetical protein
MSQPKHGQERSNTMIRSEPAHASKRNRSTVHATAKTIATHSKHSIACQAADSSKRSRGAERLTITQKSEPTYQTAMPRRWSDEIGASPAAEELGPTLFSHAIIHRRAR